MSYGLKTILKNVILSSVILPAIQSVYLCHSEQNRLCYIDLCDTSSVTYFRGKLLYHLICEMKVLSENATVSEKIRFYRTKRHMNGDTLAALIGVHRHTIIHFESNNAEPTLSNLKNIAATLDIEADKLFDDYYRFLDYPYSEKIKEIRSAHNLFQREFGAVVGVGRRAVEHWEHGKNKVTREMWEKLKELKLL